MVATAANTSDVETYQAYLERKFTAMESMLVALQAQGSYLSAAMSRLGF